MNETFQNLSIRTKLKLMALAIVALTAALGLYGYLLLDGNARKAAELEAGVLHHADIVSGFQSKTLRSIADLYRLTSTASNETDTAKVESLAKQVTSGFGSLESSLPGVKDAMAAEDFSPDQIKTFSDLLSAYGKRGKDVADMVTTDVAMATGMMTGTRQRYAAMDETLSKIVSALVAHKNETLTNIRSDMRQGEMVFAISLAVIIAIALGMSFIMGGLIANPLASVTDVLGSLAAGNLTISVNDNGRTDEVGQLTTATVRLRDQLSAAEKAKTDQVTIIVNSVGEGLSSLANGDLTARVTADLTGPFAKLKEDFNAAMARLQSTMEGVLANTNQISNGAGEVSQAADDLSRRTEQQAATLEETAAALEEITNSVKTTSRNIRSTNERAQTAKAAAEEGGAVVGTAVSAMDKIEQSSKQITDIISVIDEIAFQTNLLALNAGIEAARAGEAGKGFAVVASEVRALAGRSSDAAKQIKALISTSSEQVSEGVKLVGDTGQALNRIVEQIQEINTLVSEIAKAADQQANGIGEVNTAVGQMDQVTQQNAAMVEETTAASRTLAQATEELASQVSFFTVGEKPASRGEQRLRVVARR